MDLLLPGKSQQNPLFQTLNPAPFSIFTLRHRTHQKPKPNPQNSRVCVCGSIMSQNGKLIPISTSTAPSSSTSLIFSASIPSSRKSSSPLHTSPSTSSTSTSPNGAARTSRDPSSLSKEIKSIAWIY
ncbi:hypothetical protein AHAS_Ahas10G0097500 [Arachis hypogaea]